MCVCVAVMLEGGGNSVPLPKLQKAVKMGVSECQSVIRAIQELALKAGKTKTVFEKQPIPEDVMEAMGSVL